MNSALGENHPDTLKTMNNLTLLYSRQVHYDKADSLYIECLEKTKSILGENHPDSLDTMNNLALLYYRRGQRHAKAHSLYEESLRKSKSALGENHPGTLDTMDNLAMLYITITVNTSRSVPCMKSIWKIDSPYWAPNTLLSMNNWATFYGKQGEYKKARSLREECRERRVKI